MKKLPPRARKMIESDRTRGLVPAGPDAHLDTRYVKYLEEIDLEHDQSLLNALAVSKDMRFRELLRKLTLPSAHTRPIVYWVKAAGIDLLEMMTWFGEQQNARALALAQAAAPKVVGYMSADAESQWVACERCDGLGFVGADAGLDEMQIPGYRMLRFDEDKKSEVWVRDCPMGCVRGKTSKPGDEFSREKLLEMSGHINKKGAGLQIIQNFGGQSMPSAVNRLGAMTIDIDPAPN